MNESHGKAGPYTLQRLLATGSQSQVWQAVGPTGEIALKVARTDAHRQALRREAAVLGLGEHPGLPILVEHAPDFEWLALEAVRGSQIDQWAQVQDIEDVLRAVLELLDALEWLHGHGLLHGDVKPSNVLVALDGSVRLIDMGIASKPEDRPPGFTGTLGYAAPELLKSFTPTIPSADLYGLGAMLYTCLTGRPPFVAADPAALTYLPLVSLPAPPSSLNPDISADLEDLILDLLRRDPDRRPGIDEVRSRLNAAGDGPPRNPLLGMMEEREALRRAVVGAADGETRVVVVYGPPGSGRRSLLKEAVGFAQREGLRYHKGSDVRAILEQLKRNERLVVVLRGASANARKFSQMALRDRLPCLVLLHSDRPIPTLVDHGAIQLTPPPLNPLDITRLARISMVDEGMAEDWWRETLGLPIAVHGRIRAWQRASSSDPVDTDHLPADSLAILKALKGGHAVAVSTLAGRLGSTENRLLDHCEVLFAERLIVPEDSGNAIRLADGVTL